MRKRHVMFGLMGLSAATGVSGVTLQAMNIWAPQLLIGMEAPFALCIASTTLTLGALFLLPSYCQEYFFKTGENISFAWIIFGLLIISTLGNIPGVILQGLSMWAPHLGISLEVSFGLYLASTVLGLGAMLLFATHHAPEIHRETAIVRDIEENVVISTASVKYKVASQTNMVNLAQFEVGNRSLQSYLDSSSWQRVDEDGADVVVIKIDRIVTRFNSYNEVIASLATNQIMLIARISSAAQFFDAERLWVFDQVDNQSHVYQRGNRDNTRNFLSALEELGRQVSTSATNTAELPGHNRL